MTRLLRVAHRWLGLALVLPLLMQGISGTILAVTPVWDSARPVPAITGGPSQAASAIVAAVVAPGLVAARYHPASHGPAIVELSPPGQRAPAVRVMVDPATLAVLGSQPVGTAYRWVHSLHENLLAPQLGGRSVVGWFGVGLLLLGLSGLVLWWPAPGRLVAALRVDRRATGARLHRELHAATGVWFSAMLVLMSASGITLGFPQTVRGLLDLPAPLHSDDRAPLDLDAVLARATQAVPGAEVTDVRLPDHPGRPVVLHLRRPGTLAGTPPVVATLTASGRTVLALQDPHDQGGAALAVGWLRSLHFGEAFGLPWRLLVMLTGLALPTMAATGGTLWWLKRRNRVRLAAQSRAAPEAVRG